MTLQQSANPVRAVGLVSVTASCVCALSSGLHLRTCFDCDSEFEGLRQQKQVISKKKTQISTFAKLSNRDSHQCVDRERCRNHPVSRAQRQADMDGMLMKRALKRARMRCDPSNTQLIRLSSTEKNRYYISPTVLLSLVRAGTIVTEIITELMPEVYVCICKKYFQRSPNLYLYSKLIPTSGILYL